MPTQVINMIPNLLSGEQNQDSEPGIAVNPANPLEIAGTAFTPDPAGVSAPIFVSTDGGTTWALNPILPSAPATSDITVRFGSINGRLYGGILVAGGNLNLNIFRTNNFSAANPVTVLVNRNQVDQPFTMAASILGGGGAGTDRVYVGNNDFAVAPRTATVDVSLDGGNAAPPPPSNFIARRLDPRVNTLNQDQPQIRPAVHLDGTVYAAYYQRTAQAGSIRTCNVVVVRDDNWAAGGAQFAALVDAGDGQAGQRLIQGVQINWQNNSFFGQERLGGGLAIAVDPRNSDTVYVGWCDTNGSTQTLHVRRSTDRGQTWSGADLRQVLNAINPALAISSRGRVALMYQTLTGALANQRWETHLELTDNDWVAVNDRILATVPSNAPAFVFLPYLGDYIQLMSLGKDFYGVFSANNTPNVANFPQGVTYQRNANFVSQTLLANDGVTAVPISIDPFFVRETELTPDTDVYVRDWTDSPTSGDNGLEPSNHPWFFVNPDVWNRQTNVPGGFDANDRPINEEPIPGTGALGDNFAFARLRRNASGTPLTVTARFLVSPFGTGSAYQDAGLAAGTTVNFGAGDLIVTSPGHQWHLDPIMSTHLCLATEISTPADPVVTPGLLGRTPGWPTTDLMIINDNNKAQRNMGIAPAAPDGGGIVYALIRNAAYEIRDIVLRYAIREDVAGRVRYTPRVVGGRGPRPVALEGQLVLKRMLPGENRWVELSFRLRAKEPDEPIPIVFHEMVGNAPVNGFAIAPQPATPSDVARWTMEEHYAVFSRMAATFGFETAGDEAQLALQLLEKKRLNQSTYVRFVSKRRDSIVSTCQRLRKAGNVRDPFGITDALRELGTSKPGDLASAHASLLRKLDAFQTTSQKAVGEPADVLYNAEWQQVIVERQPRLQELPLASELHAASVRFVAAFEARKVGADDFPRLLQEILEPLADVAKMTGSYSELDRLRHSLGSTATAQRAHRDFLLAVEAALT